MPQFKSTYLDVVRSQGDFFLHSCTVTCLIMPLNSINIKAKVLVLGAAPVPSLHGVTQH